MKKYLIFIFLAALTFSLVGCTAGSINPPQEESTRIIRIGTYNLQDFFDDNDDPYKADGFAPSEEKLEARADVILEAGCDILAVQEVENPEVLINFNQAFLDGYYPYITLSDGNDPRGIDVGFMSKFPFEHVVSYHDRTFNDPAANMERRFPRDVFIVQLLDSYGRTWNFMTTHLKSGRTVEDSHSRELQMEEIRTICLEDGYISTSGGGLTIIMGDLNAEPWTPEFKPLMETPFSDPGRDYMNRYTHDSGKTLDYILLSPDVDRCYVPGSYAIFQDYPASSASDHYLVSLDLII
jgi:endonuclease/exonuclease/phosphatase family metal-dependent hydrolase